MVVGDVGFELRLPSFGVTVEAIGVGIELDGSRLVLPRASAVFSPETLLRRLPSQIVVSGLDVEFSLDAEEWRTSPLGLLAGAVSASSAPASEGGQKTRQIVIDDARVRIHPPSGDADPVLLEISSSNSPPHPMVLSSGSWRRSVLSMTSQPAR